MLTEIKDTRQIPGEPFRRWFAEHSSDLIVWYDEDHVTIVGFQLCYPEEGEEKALTWHRDRGYTHQTVDDGEERPGRHKMSPILTPDGVFHRGTVLELFQGNTQHLDPDIVAFISRKLEKYLGNIN